MRKILYLSLVLLTASTPLCAQTYTVLRNFGDVAGAPSGAIAQSRGGAMLTTTIDLNGNGKAFKIWTDGSLQILHQFAGKTSGGLTLATDGMFYGTTQTGGTLNLGTIFKMSQDGTVTTLHEFQGGSEGEYPTAAPIQSAQGDFYGTTAGILSAGNINYGSIYRITKEGNFTLLHTFAQSDGAYPQGPLVQGTDYYFYGTTPRGGQNNVGTIFRISRSGEFKVLVNFNKKNGSLPYAGLIQANDGNFYGVTSQGGAWWPAMNGGVLFRMTPSGVLAVLHSFSGGSDGLDPVEELIQAPDGNLYGTTRVGGKNGYGTLFRATRWGDHMAVLHDFDEATGSFPRALIQHTNGKLYGDTPVGGQLGKGVFYSLDAGLPPFVTYLPTYGRAGALVQILGQGFTSASQVSFNGKLAASPVVVYPTYLRVIVPSGATSGPITVTTDAGTLTSSKVFIVHRY